VCYANAGHTPGLLRDNTGITPLEATGLPLGLFSHTMQSAASCHLMPGSALLVVSRGIVEADCVDADHQAAEFGLDGVKQSFQNATAPNASELCLTVLQAARKFIPTTPTHNDLTTLVLVRTASAIMMRSETPALTAPKPAHITVSFAGHYNDLPEAAMYQPSARNCSIERS
jgi:serine phosphatase RsbU (regulator of sigma subunit)